MCRQHSEIIINAANKVSGTHDGITACQMDIKVVGLIHVGDELLTPINLIQRCSQAYHQVKVIAFDEKNGKIKLSRKALLPKPEGYEEEKPRRNGNGGGNGPRRDGDRGRGPRRDGNGGGERRSSGNGGGRRR